MGYKQIPTAGFTLVELITVIMIVSILGLVAAMRYVNLRTESYRNLVFATAAAFASAANMAHAACITRNYFGGDNMPGYADGNVDFSPTCHPASTNNANGPVNAARCVQIWNAILDHPPTINSGAGLDTDYRAQGSGTTCTYTYKQDQIVLRQFTYSTQTGAVTVSNP